MANDDGPIYNPDQGRVFAPTHHPAQGIAASGHIGLGGGMASNQNPVEAALSELQEKVDLVNSLLDNLSVKLEPLMAPQAPATAAPEAPLRGGNSLVAGRLYSAIGGLEALRDRLIDTHSRLEI